MRNRVGRSGLALVAVLVLAGCAEPTVQRPGGPVETPGFVELQPMPSPPLGPPPTDHLAPELTEQLAYPPVTEEMLDVIDRLRAAAGSDPDAGDPELSLDRTQVIVRWHGEVPAAVQDVVDDHATGPFTVVVEQTAFPPGELRAEAFRLMDAHPGVVVGVSARNTGDGLDVMVPSEVVAAAGGLAEALAEHGVVSRFPLFPSEGSVVPA